MKDVNFHIPSICSILKTQKPPFRAAFAYVMPSGTVLPLMGNGTGSWRHNRVAGSIIESNFLRPIHIPTLLQFITRTDTISTYIDIVIYL